MFVLQRGVNTFAAAYKVGQREVRLEAKRKVRRLVSALIGKEDLMP